LRARGYDDYLRAGSEVSELPPNSQQPHSGFAVEDAGPRRDNTPGLAIIPAEEAGNGMSADSSFADFMARLRAGDPLAADQLFRQFAGRLIVLARGRLEASVRAKVDPEDVVQSVFGSFFRRQVQSDFALDSWDGLWGLLTTITLRKCGHRLVYFHAARRDVQREVRPETAGDASASGWEALTREPTPLEAAMLTETIEELMRWLPEDRDRRILQLSLQGYTVPEISAQVQRSERTVQRVLAHVRRQLECLRDNGADG
jgi:RNA polymerase sigma factor (sigma-70 family)